MEHKGHLGNVRTAIVDEGCRIGLSGSVASRWSSARTVSRSIETMCQPFDDSVKRTALPQALRKAVTEADLHGSSRDNGNFYTASDRKRKRRPGKDFDSWRYRCIRRRVVAREGNINVYQGVNDQIFPGSICEGMCLSGIQFCGLEICGQNVGFGINIPVKQLGNRHFSSS
ncbi:hypothetical protein SJ05684_c21790 [Sinorhizobium sojae CCBAU 05684]|uniref:Uncharacterized protein n=1 Tax=Sinorhizobium sojae CCBAU 05684 TaxID=716928 RepID=A0A249PCD6_9HYPH|nr:hypothetical protein SJ05684_c21790 [Sinorhizobium sojae CCBAU 05684]